MQNFNPIRGTSDNLPDVALVRERARQTILECYQKNGFNLISTPILENLNFLNSSDGGDNLRLMFKTVKRGDKLDLTKPDLREEDIVEEGLRYDLTVPLARFYANNRDKLPTPFKSIQIDHVFRAERPQKGRERQFIQCDVDIFGDATVNAELELILTAFETYSRLGLENLVLKINHRKILNSIVLFAGFLEQDIPTVCVTLDKMDKISLSGVYMELIEKGFDTDKINKLIDIVSDISAHGLDAVSAYGVDKQTVADVKFLLDNVTAISGGKYVIKFDISIVRGQGYYTGAVFEMYTDGFGGAIGGGGRYDNMVGKLTGQSTPAVGFGLGFEPVVLLLSDKFKGEGKRVALIYDQDDNIVSVFKAKEELKSEFCVSLFLRPKNMKNFYDKIGSVADYVCTVKDHFKNLPMKKLK